MKTIMDFDGFQSNTTSASFLLIKKKNRIFLKKKSEVESIQ